MLGVRKSISTAQLSPVFDASNKEKDSHSLDDCLGKDPNLIDSIEGWLKMSLICAKSKVTTTKQLTLHRLELMGAPIRLRLGVLILSRLDRSNLSMYYWCDSSVVLT